MPLWLGSDQRPGKAQRKGLRETQTPRVLVCTGAALTSFQLPRAQILLPSNGSEFLPQLPLSGLNNETQARKYTQKRIGKECHGLKHISVQVLLRAWPRRAVVQVLTKQSRRVTLPVLPRMTDEPPQGCLSVFEVRDQCESLIKVTDALSSNIFPSLPGKSFSYGLLEKPCAMDAELTTP